MNREGSLYIIHYRQTISRSEELATPQTQGSMVAPGDPLPGSRRWLPDPATGVLRPELRDSLTSGFGYVDPNGELHEEHRVSLNRRYWALRRLARLVHPDHHVFMLTVSNLGHDPDVIRAWLASNLQPLRLQGAHWLHVVEDHKVSDDLHAHVLIYAPRTASITANDIHALAAASLPSERSTVKVDEAATRDDAEKLAAYVGKTLRSDPDRALVLNTPSTAKRNSAYSHTRGFWRRGGWRGVYRNNLAALRDPERATKLAVERRADLLSASIVSMRALRAKTALIYTLFSFSNSSRENDEIMMRASENDEHNPQNLRTRTQNARAPPSKTISHSPEATSAPPFKRLQPRGGTGVSTSRRIIGVRAP